MLDLKNCPFCGGDNVSVQHGTTSTRGQYLMVWCVSCQAAGGEHLVEAEATAAWNRRTLQAVGPEPAVAGVETCKFYHSQWPVEDRLKARGPYGLITDDGEAWRYEYTHSDADGGPYDVVCRPRSALVATPPAEPVVEALPPTREYVDRIVRIFRDRPDDDSSSLVLHDYALAALAAKDGRS